MKHCHKLSSLWIRCTYPRFRLSFDNHNLRSPTSNPALNHSWSQRELQVDSFQQNLFLSLQASPVSSQNCADSSNCSKEWYSLHPCNDPELGLAWQSCQPYLSFELWLPSRLIVWLPSSIRPRQELACKLHYSDFDRLWSTWLDWFSRRSPDRRWEAWQC